MRFQINREGLNDHGKILEGEVVKRYVNGFAIEVDFDGEKETAFVQRSDMKILDATEEELNFPIEWR